MKNCCKWILQIKTNRLCNIGSQIHKLHNPVFRVRKGHTLEGTHELVRLYCWGLSSQMCGAVRKKMLGSKYNKHNMYISVGWVSLSSPSSYDHFQTHTFSFCPFVLLFDFNEISQIKQITQQVRMVNLTCRKLEADNWILVIKVGIKHPQGEYKLTHGEQQAYSRKRFHINPNVGFVTAITTKVGYGKEARLRSTDLVGFSKQ